MANANLITQVLGNSFREDLWPPIITGLRECKYYAYIYHEHDVYSQSDIIEAKEQGRSESDIKEIASKIGLPKPKHLHFVAEDRMSLKNWLKLLNLDYVKISYAFRGANRYLLHLDDSEKFLYNKSDVVTNKPIRFTSYLEDNIELSPKNLCEDLSRLRKGDITRDDFLKKYEFWLNKQSFYSQFKIYSELLKWS